jgi:hypothetical protein
MADNANDKPQRSAADKERSRQMSRSVSGKDAARSTGGGGGRTGQAQGGRGPARGGRTQQARDGQGRNQQAGRGGQGRNQAKGGRTGPGGSGGVRNARAGQRPGQRGGRPQRRPVARQGRSRTNLYIWGSIALVVVIVGIFVGVSLSSSTPTPIIYKAKPVPAKVLSEVTHVPASVYNSVGTGITGAIAAPRAVTGQPALKYTGKPGIFGLFGQFCPYCAAERWAIITSFSRFGTFSGLRTMQSSPVDIYSKTQTFTFEKATYTSPYISAKLVEYFGQDYNSKGAHRVIGKITKAQERLIVKYDHSATTTSQTGSLSIPFMDIGNQFIAEGVSYSPGPLATLTRTTIAAGLSNPNSTVTKLIIGTSNYLSASICHIDGGKPGSVCTSAGVKAAAKAMNLSS